MSISVIIPAYNEEKRIGHSLKKISDYLIKNFKTYEILVVNDGSKDNTVFLVMSLNIPKLKVIDSKINAGKGSVVKRGMKLAKYDLVLFTDSDLATPIEELDKLLPHAKNFDVVIASRNMKTSDRKVKQPLYRQILGKLFPLFVRFFLFLPIKDTQCGFKLFSKKSAKFISKHQTIKRWAFDVEQLFIAKKHGFKIKEVAVVWIDVKGSKVNTIKDGFRMGCDVFRVFRNNILGRYKF